MSSKMQSSNNIAQARRSIQQLRIEASIERIKVNVMFISLNNGISVKYYYFMYSMFKYHL